MKKKFFTALRLLLFLTIGFLFIWIFLKDLTSAQKKQILESFSLANYWWLILSFFIGFLSHIFRTLRWEMLLHTINYKPQFKNTFLSLMIGYFANLAIPRLGEVTRCSILTKYEKIPFEKSFGTVVAERAFDILTFLILFFVNLLLQYNKISGYVHQHIFHPLSEKFTFIGKGYILYFSVVIIIIVSLFLIVFIKKLKKLKFFQKVIQVIRGFWDGLKSLSKVKNPLLFLLYTILIWLMYYLMSYVCFFSLVETSNPGLDAVFSVLIMGTIGIMVVQGGIGIYPVIVAETLTLYGITSIVGFALGWLIWGAQTFILLLAGIISLILLPLLNRNNYDTSPKYQ